MPTSPLPRLGRGSLSACRCNRGARLHATAVARGRRGLLILGASGAGKSRLATQMLALGARLVADDAVEIRAGRDGRAWARAPDGAAAGMIESRGIGLLGAPRSGPVPIALVVDLDRPECQRLPAFRYVTFAGVQLPLLHNPESADLPSALYHYLWYGRRDPDALLNETPRHDHASR